MRPGIAAGVQLRKATKMSTSIAAIESLAELAWLQPVESTDYEEKKLDLPESQLLNITICGTCG